MFRYGKDIFKLERGKQLLLFLFCLFLAFVIWSVHNLSNNYSHFFQYRVFSNSKIKGRNTTSGSLNNLTIRGRATGFYILQHRFSLERQLHIEPESTLFRKIPNKENSFFILTSDIRDVIIESVSDKLIVDYISADTLFFQFPKMAIKEVPVSVQSRVTFKEQYTSFTGLQVDPPQITLSGEERILDEIDSVYTEVVLIQRANKNESGFVKIKPLKGVVFSEDEVYYTLETKRYIEQKQEIPVSVLNVPDTIDVIVSPPFFTLYAKVGMSLAEDIDITSVTYAIDYNQSPKTGTFLVTPKISLVNQGAFSYRTEPPVLEVKVVRKY